MDRNEIDRKIEQYGGGFDLLAAALADTPKEAWEYIPEPTEWSVHEIIIHLADSESMSALRARKLIVEPGSALMGYEEPRWADALNYREQSAEDALEIIRLARLTTYRILKILPEEVFKNSVSHPEYQEPYTFENWLNIYASHIPNHIEQIRNNVKLWREQL